MDSYVPILGGRTYKQYHLVSPLSEQDRCIRIRHLHRHPDMQRPRPRRILLQLDIIRRHHVRQHRFQLVCGKETRRTDTPSARWQR